MVWYHVGGTDDPPGLSGAAHFFEHLMFRGTKNVPNGELSKIVTRNGGQDNAQTSYDFTVYFQRIAKDRLPIMMGLEADRMVNLDLSENNVLTDVTWCWKSAICASIPNRRRLLRNKSRRRCTSRTLTDAR
jgi:zinc protease